MSKRTHKPPKPKLPRSALASTVLLLSCPPLWGDGLQLEIDEARPTFRVVGATTKEAIAEAWRKPLLTSVPDQSNENYYAVSFSADGSLLLSEGHGGTVRLWDTTTGKTTLRVMESHDLIRAVSLSADGSIALSGGGAMTVSCACGIP